MPETISVVLQVKEGPLSEEMLRDDDVMLVPRNPKPETRNPKFRVLKPEIRNFGYSTPKPEIRSLNLETRNPTPETRNPKPET